MKKIAIALFLLVVIYLNRSYAYFYNFKSANLPSLPSSDANYVVGGGTKHLKLAVLGDSLMAGIGAQVKNQTMPYLIAQHLSQVSSSSVGVDNLAFPGAGVGDVYKYELPKVLKEKPDVIVLMIGINDVHNLKTVGYFQNYYTQVLDALHQTGSKITLVNIPYLGSSSILFFPWNYLIDLRTKQFNDIIHKLSEDKNLALVDLYDPTKEQFEKASDLYSPDQFHPSVKGYTLFANYIDADLHY